jgi:hypothetical protein
LLTIIKQLIVVKLCNFALLLYTKMIKKAASITTHFIGQNIERKIGSVNTSLLDQETIAQLLNNKVHIAHLVEVFDLDQGRASRSAKHVKKFLFKRALDPFEVLVHLN